MAISIGRRRLALGLGATLAGACLPPATGAAPTDRFDLLIKGGEVLDPSQGLRAVRDVGIRHGRSPLSRSCR